MPDRIVGDQVVAAGAGDADPVVLGGVAAVVWVELDEWTTEGEVAGRLANAFPDVAEQERSEMLAQALRMLDEAGLLERRDR